jgi:hypothetical protein
MDNEDELMRRSGCSDFDQEEPEDGPEDFEQEQDTVAPSRLKDDPDAMETNIATDTAKKIITDACKAANVRPPNMVAMGVAVEIIRGLSPFNAEHMIANSINADGLSLVKLRGEKHRFDRAVD